MENIEWMRHRKLRISVPEKYNLLTYLLTPWCRTLFEKLMVTQPVKNILLSLWNPKAHHLVRKSSPLDPILSQPNPICPSIPISLKSI